MTGRAIKVFNFYIFFLGGGGGAEGIGNGVRRGRRVKGGQGRNVTIQTRAITEFMYTTYNLIILQTLISKYLSKRRGKLYIGCVDFKAAFDSVQRNKLWPVLQHAGIKGNLLKSIQSVYKSVKSFVRVNNSHTDFFDCPVGLRQGCMMSPVLFSLFINELVDLIENSGL